MAASQVALIERYIIECVARAQEDGADRISHVKVPRKLYFALLRESTNLTHASEKKIHRPTLFGHLIIPSSGRNIEVISGGTNGQS